MLKKIIRRHDLLPDVLVSVRACVNVFGKKDLKDGLSVVECHMPAGFSPMGYAIGLRNDDSLSGMIRKSGCFVVNFMGSEHQEAVILLKSMDGCLSDAFHLLNLQKEEGLKIESPRIAQAKAFLECELIHELESGDHTVFLGRVLHSEMR